MLEVENYMFRPISGHHQVYPKYVLQECLYNMPRLVVMLRFHHQLVELSIRFNYVLNFISSWCNPWTKRSKLGGE
jgi:hypothetical protein